MSEIERRIELLELKLPGPIQLPPSVKLSFPRVRLHGDRAYLSGHGLLAEDARAPRRSARSYGPQRGSHSRSAVGMAGLPFDMPVEIEAEVALEY